VFDDSGEPPSILRGLGWLRSIGVLSWYYGTPDTLAGGIPSLAGAVETYCGALQEGLVDAPSMSQSAQDGLFRYGT
jgi:hypothetical protein